MRRTTFLAGTAVAAIALLLAACNGGDGDNAGTKPKRTTTTSSTTSTTSPAGSTTAPPTTTTPGSSSTTTTTAATAGTCGTQTATITDAIQGTDVAGLSGQAANYTVVNCRIAPSNPIWAAADAAPKPGTGFQGGVVVLQRIGALWTVEAFGTDRVGCDAPAPVPAELALPC